MNFYYAFESTQKSTKRIITFIPRWLIMDVLLKFFLEHNEPLFTGCSLDDDNIQ